MGLISTHTEVSAGYAGRRMSADAYLALLPDTRKYELINGVVCMSPSASFSHQMIAGEVMLQIGMFLERRSIGVVVAEVDVRLSDEQVFRPDVVFLTSEKAARCGVAVTVPPDVAIEVVSPDSRENDAEIKRKAYEIAGISEYWLIDPIQENLTFLRLTAGRYLEQPASGDYFESAAIPGFRLDLSRIRRLF